MNLKPEDKVLITRPSSALARAAFPLWTNPMDEWNGAVCTISRINTRTNGYNYIIHVKETEYVFCISWVTLKIEEEPETLLQKICKKAIKMETEFNLKQQTKRNQTKCA